jgi:hypothetical protein
MTASSREVGTIYSLISEGAPFHQKLVSLGLRVPCRSLHLSGLMGYAKLRDARNIAEFVDSIFSIQGSSYHFFDEGGRLVRALLCPSCLLFLLVCLGSEWVGRGVAGCGGLGAVRFVERELSRSNFGLSLCSLFVQIKNSSVRLSPSVETKRLIRVAKHHPQGINYLGDRNDERMAFELKQVAVLYRIHADDVVDAVCCVRGRVLHVLLERDMEGGYEGIYLHSREGWRGLTCRLVPFP